MALHLLQLLAGKTVLVTGATGFIGSHLCPVLSEAQAHVVALSHKAPVRTPNGVDSHEIVALHEQAAVYDVISRLKPHAIIHLASQVTAARHPDLIFPMFESNLLSSINIFHAAAEQGVSRVVVAGSMEEPGTGDRATSPYAAAKAATRIYADLYSDMTELSVAHVKIAMGYGSRQHDSSKLVPYVIQQLLKGDVPKVTSGARKADWVHGHDIARGLALVAAAEKLPLESIMLGTGELTSVREVVEKLCRISDTGIEAQFGSLPDRAAELSNVANTEVIKSQLNWEPIYSLEAGLQETWEWFRGQGG